MLTVTQRAYTDAELDAYSDRMSSRSSSFLSMVVLGLVVGTITLLSAFALHWVYARVTGGSASWTFPLVCGSAATILTIVGLWFMDDDTDDWTEHPPELSTELHATADAAWGWEFGSLELTFAWRVEPDRYLILHEESLETLTPDLFESGETITAIGSAIHAIFLGEGDYRTAIHLSISGPSLPLTPVQIRPQQDDPDPDDETPIPEGLYTAVELPAGIRRALARV